MGDGIAAREGRAAISETVRCVYGQDWLTMDPREAGRQLQEIADPELTFVPEPGTGGAVSGITEVLRLLTDARAEWSSCRYLLDEIREVDATEAVVIGRVVATLRCSRSRVSFPFVHAWRARGSRIHRIEAYTDRDQASTALGWSL
jgi:ketosteroid isomerase-like protein